MSVFISWSGENAAKVGEGFRQLLRHTLQGLGIFISSESIRAGKLWFKTIQEGLEAAKYGVVVATPRSLSSPWVQFESGAIWKAKTEADVAVLRVGLTADQLRGHPLEHFNSTGISKHEVRRLLDDIAFACGHRVDADVLSSAFEANWPTFEVVLQGLTEEAAPVATTAPQNEGLRIIGERLSSLEQFSLERLQMDRVILDVLNRLDSVSRRPEENAFAAIGRGGLAGLAAQFERKEQARPRSLAELLGEPGAEPFRRLTLSDILDQPEGGSASSQPPPITPTKPPKKKG